MLPILLKEERERWSQHPLVKTLVSNVVERITTPQSTVCKTNSHNHGNGQLAEVTHVDEHNEDYSYASGINGCHESDATKDFKVGGVNLSMLVDSSGASDNMIESETLRSLKTKKIICTSQDKFVTNKLYPYASTTSLDILSSFTCLVEVGRFYVLCYN